MSLFAEHMQQIFDSAVAASQAGGSPSQMTILIGDDDRISMVADSDWPLDSLARERGAKSAYRVTGAGGSIRVEGRQGLRRCVMESEDPARTARLLLGA